MSETKKRLNSLKKQKAVEKNRLFSVFEDYNEENICIEVYKKKKAEITEKIKNIDKEIDFIELNFAQKSNNIYYSAITDVSREVVERFIKAIYILGNNKYKIEWKE